MEGEWQVAGVEGAGGNYCSGMWRVDTFSVLSLGIQVTSSPSRGVRREISWSARVLMELCAGGMWRVENACTREKVIKDGLAH